MTVLETRFDPQVHGFLFFEEAFEEGLELSLPYEGKLSLGKLVRGLAAGMTFAALDRFHADGFFPLDRASEAVRVWLQHRQADALPPQTVLDLLQLRLMEAPARRAALWRRATGMVRRSIARGEPLALALVGVETCDFGVLRACESLAEKELRWWIYLPTLPGQEIPVQVRLTPDGLEFISSEHRWEGFLMLPYHPQPVPAFLHSRGMTGASAEPVEAEPLPSDTLRGQPLDMDRGMEMAAMAMAEPVEAEAVGAAPAEGAPAEVQIRLRWPVDSRRINQYFGENPATYKPFGLPGHEGLDLYAPDGANIYAAADGMVEMAGHPSGHPYGLQIRLRHEVSGKVFRTIYAHLSKVLVRQNDAVKAGDLIALADNTGNSFGSHLHLTLKIEGAKTPGYPAEIVDPLPYLEQVPPPPSAPVEPLPPESGIEVFTTAPLNLREAPHTTAGIRAGIPAGERLMTLGDPVQIQDRIGREGQWLQVRTAGGTAGWVAAWFVQRVDQTLPPSDVVAYPVGAVNLRAGPGTGFDVLAALQPTDALTVLGNSDLVRAKIGRQGEWLQVQTAQGMRGFVAAWLVHLTGQSPAPCGVVVYPVGALNVRARPALDANVLVVASPGDALEVLGDRVEAQAKVGKQGEWLNVRTPQKFVGYVAAWLVAAQKPASPATPAETLLLKASVDLNLRAQPTLNAPRVGGIRTGETFRVLETDLTAAGAKVGKTGEWIYGENPQGVRGWAAAWFLIPREL
ncbi:MAG: SH3 domain-containing protein [Anaerolinea sp.]